VKVDKRVKQGQKPICFLLCILLFYGKKGAEVKESSNKGLSRNNMDKIALRFGSDLAVAIE
jgi:hypothetical protein